MYPTFEELQGDPQYWLHGEPPVTYYLTIGVSAWKGLEDLGWAWEKKNNTVRTMAPDARRTYDRNQRRNWAGRGGKRIA